MQQVQAKVLECPGEVAPSRSERSLEGAGLTEENSERIGFVLSCLLAGAINTAELRIWAKKVRDESESPPRYLTDLVDYNGRLFHIYNVIGFGPHWDHTNNDTLALSGIAFKRDRQPFDHPIMREEALRKLEQNSPIEKRFRSEFTFLNW